MYLFIIRMLFKCSICKELFNLKSIVLREQEMITDKIKCEPCQKKLNLIEILFNDDFKDWKNIYIINKRSNKIITWNGTYWIKTTIL